MNSQERALARIMFKNLVYSSDGQAYESLFTKVMDYACSDFVQIKPQGRIGDKKNDGYDRQKGHYYQVYSPENRDSSEINAVKKLKEDFGGLIKYWQHVYPIRRFSFVFNDKFKGSFPTIETDLAAIQSEHKLESCSSFLAKHLEDTLFGLEDDQILAIIGHIPDPSQIKTIDYSILREVINLILTSRKLVDSTILYNAPDFTDKIEFNGLGPQTASLLQVGSFHVGEINDYFKLNAEYIKQELRDALNRIYLNAKSKYNEISASNRESLADLIFFNILDEISPEKTKDTQDAAIVIMAYFFESCDIFEDPASDVDPNHVDA